MAYTASSWLRWSTSLSISLSLIFAAVPPTALTAQESTVGPAHLDLTNNQYIDDIDALKVLEGWRSLAEADACTSDVLASRDVNNSGCVDIADVQSVLASWGQSTNPSVPVPDKREDTLSVQATFTVNSTGFEPDTNPGDGQCRTALNTCTLKAAVDEATNRNGRDTIVFDVRNGDGSCPNLVTIEAPPDLTEGIEIDDKFVDGVVIDGYTQCGASPNTRSLHDPNGSNAVIKVELKGNRRQDVHGIELDSAHNIIRGLAIYNWDFQVKLSYSPSFDNRVQGSFLGTDAATTFRYEASSPFGEQHHEGLRIQGGPDSGASSNIIGGRTPDTRNIISGNRKDGLKIQGRSTNNLIMGNYIGLKKDGKSSLRNYTDAVDFEYGPQYNTLGGDEPEEGNIISGNYSEGIEISHGTDTQYNTVAGNYFGVSADGTKSVPNTGSGITFEDRVDSNYAYNNVIVNNGTSGVFFFILATRNQVVNNKIGVGPNGTTPMPNGTTTEIDPYYERSGVVIMGGSQHNLIQSNIIANHPGDAIILKNTSNDENGQYGETFYNTLSQNTTYNNGATEEDDVEGDGIILKPFYHSNNTVTYPNEGIRQPTISAAATNQVRGNSKLRSNAACANCTIEIFIADKSSTNDPSGDNAGEGRTYVTNGTTDSSGNFSIGVCGTTTLTQGQIVTITSTDTKGNTSQFSANVAVGAAVTPDPCAEPSPTPSPSPSPSPTPSATPSPTPSPSPSPSPSPGLPLPPRVWFPLVKP